MAKVPLRSGVVSHAEYDEASQALTLTFKDGSVYEYTDVPLLVQQELVIAHSPGHYFSTNIRGVYQARPKDQANEEQT